MRRFWVGLVATALVLAVGGSAYAFTIYDPNLGHNRNVPIRSYEGLDTPRHGEFGDIEMSGCQLVLDEPSIGYPALDGTPRYPVSARMFLQCDPVDLLFTGYEWTFDTYRDVRGTWTQIESSGGGKDFGSGPRVPALWGEKVFEHEWACKDLNPSDRGTAGRMIEMRGTLTLIDTEHREYPSKVTFRGHIVCPTVTG